MDLPHLNQILYSRHSKDKHSNGKLLCMVLSTPNNINKAHHIRNSILSSTLLSYTHSHLEDHFPVLMAYSTLTFHPLLLMHSTTRCLSQLQLVDTDRLDHLMECN